MKQKKKPNIYITSTGAAENSKIQVSRFVIFLIFVLICAMSTVSMLGYSRVIKHSYAHLGVDNKKRENRDLLRKVVFFRKLFEQYNNKIDDFVSFEDNTRLKYGLNVINEEIRLAGIGGPPSLEEALKDAYEDPVVLKVDSIEKKCEGLLRQISLQDSTISRMASYLSMIKNKWAQYPSIRPAQGRVTSTFGMRFHPFLGRMYFHDGMDIANKTWTPVFATADGVISLVGFKGDYGMSVMIDHYGGAYTTVYAHLVDAVVEEGQVVRRNECIGYLGNTGRSTGPHLHYEVRKFDKPTNPISFILPKDIIIN